MYGIIETTKSHFIKKDLTPMSEATPTIPRSDEILNLWELLGTWRKEETRTSWDLLMKAKQELDESLSQDPEIAFTPEVVKDGKHLLAELVYAEFEGKTKFASELEAELLTSQLLGQWIKKHSKLTGSSKKAALYIAHLFAQNFNLQEATEEDVVAVPRSQAMEDLQISQITMVRANHAMTDSGEWEIVPGIGPTLTTYRPLFLNEALDLAEGDI